MKRKAKVGQWIRVTNGKRKWLKGKVGKVISNDYYTYVDRFGYEIQFDNIKHPFGEWWITDDKYYLFSFDFEVLSDEEAMIEEL